jgi:hypothetical protein
MPNAYRALRFGAVGPDVMGVSVGTEDATGASTLARYGTKDFFFHGTSDS